VRRSGSTGSLVAIVALGGERSFFTDRGATTALDGVDPAWLGGCGALHVPAYSFDGEPLATTAAALVDAAHQGGLLTSVDCSSTSLVSRMGVGSFRSLLERLGPTVVFANRDEAHLVGLGPGRPAPGADLTIVREGGDQTWVVTADGDAVPVPVPVVEGVVDTTGAGDAFAAGFLLATLAGASAVEATREGHRVAAMVLTTAGATVRRSAP
jgi:sugar/nucleoside kinase (ribokinase family)